MARTIVFWRFPSDAGTFSASSTFGPGYPAANLQKFSILKAWKSAATLATETADTDFGSAVPIDTFAAWGHDILSTDTITLEYADDAAFTAGVVTPALAWREKYLFSKFTEITKRYRRLTIAKTVAATSKKIGRMVDGVSYVMSEGLQTPGFQFGPGMTTSTKNRTASGVLYGNLGVAIDRMPARFPPLPQDDIDELYELERTIQTVNPFILVTREGESNQSAIYGTIDKMNLAREVTPDPSAEIPWSMTEQK